MRGLGQVALGKFVMIHTTRCTLQMYPLCRDLVNVEVSEFARAFTRLVPGAEAGLRLVHTGKAVLVGKDVS